jgi:hypothetical protein
VRDLKEGSFFDAQVGHLFDFKTPSKPLPNLAHIQPMPDVSLVSSDSRSAGPWAILKTQKCHEIAHTIMQQEWEKIHKKQHNWPYKKPKSTATSANMPTLERLTIPLAIDVSIYTIKD